MTEIESLTHELISLITEHQRRIDKWGASYNDWCQTGNILLIDFSKKLEARDKAYMSIRNPVRLIYELLCQSVDSVVMELEKYSPRHAVTVLNGLIDAMKGELNA